LASRGPLLRKRICKIFHLHRNIVGFGPRKSDFFIEHFRKYQKDTNNHHDDSSKVTRLVLPLEEAKVFPMILDYIYCTKEVKQTLTAARACALFKLAEHLCLTALQKALMTFYKKTISLTNMKEFLICAQKFKVQHLLVVSKAKAGTMIVEKPELAGLVPLNFLADIIQIYRKQFEELDLKDPNNKQTRVEALGQ
jgi:hypothetical protein